MAEGDGVAAGSPGGRVGDQSGSVFQRGSSDFGTFKTSLGEMGKDKSLEPIKDFKGLTESFINAQKMIGGSIRLPKPDATPEDKQKFNDEIYTKLGRPDKPESYQFKRPAFGEGLWDANLEKTFLGIAHKIGLNHSQLQELVNFEANRLQTGLQANAKAREGNVSQLKNEWGADFPRKAELAKRAFTQLATDAGIIAEAKDFFINTGLGDHPIILKMFHEVGEILAESGFIDGRVAGAGDANEIKAKIDAMFTDPKHPMNDISHPLHKQAVEEYTKLFKQHSELKG